jgi:hypothetical protein
MVTQSKLASANGVGLHAQHVVGEAPIDEAVASHGQHGGVDVAERDQARLAHLPRQP